MWEAAKTEGNNLFRAGRPRAALEKYTEAIALNGAISILYSNRALCHKALEQWPSVVDDAKEAIRLDSLNAKAFWLLGTALVHLGEHWDDAIAALEGARKLAKRSGSKHAQWVKLVDAQLAKAHRAAHDATVAREVSALESAQETIVEALEEYESRSSSLTPRRIGERKRAEIGHSRQVLTRVFQEKRKLWQDRHVPDYLCCPLTMSIFVDPVVTPSGNTFEREALEQALSLRAVDPITAQPVSPDQVVPNRAIRDAAEHFRRENPWAHDE